MPTNHDGALRIYGDSYYYHLISTSVSLIMLNIIQAKR